MQNSGTILSNSEDETLSLARDMAAHLNNGDVVNLVGDLGSGKTVFAKGMAWGLGIDPNRVISPTFTIVREYHGRLPYFHIDLYRITLREELLSIGLDEYLFSDGVSAVEWGDKFNDMLPTEHIRILFDIISDGVRRINIKSDKTIKELNMGK